MNENVIAGTEQEKTEDMPTGKVAQRVYPLVSCIMPTAGRPAYVLRSIGYFLAQDYPNKELVIVYNKQADLPQCAPGVPYQFTANVRFVEANTKILGAKRNEACRHARGAIIAQWDDDDIYNTNRLTQQVMPILAGEAEITGLNNFVFYEACTGDCWLPDTNLFSQIYVGNVHGGSLVYNRAVWDSIGNYPNFSTGEDAWFLRKALKNGARLKPMDGYDTFVYVRHFNNTWQIESGNFDDGYGWLPATMPAWAGKMSESIALGNLAPDDSSEIDYPLVSCVVPTSARPQYLLRSLYYFTLQTYPNKELIVVYNRNTDLPRQWMESPELLPANVKLVKTAKTVLGAKRNEGTRFAAGAIIAQWDDDDIYGENRLMAQALPILNGQADITGVNNFVFYEIANGLGYMPTNELFRTIFKAGVACGTLVFNRAVWDNLAKYPDASIAEDYQFQNKVLAQGARLKVIDGYDLFAYVRHQNNTWQFEKDNFRRYVGWQNAAIPGWIQPYVPLYSALASRDRIMKEKSRKLMAV